MPIYILLSRLSQQGVQTLQSNPARLQEVNRDVEELGAKVLHQWATLGEFDFVNVVDAPDAPRVRGVGVPPRGRPGGEDVLALAPPGPGRRAALGHARLTAEPRAGP